MILQLLKKNLTLVLTALFLAIGMISVKAQNNGSITNVVISGPVCAGSTVTVSFNATSGNGTPRQFTNLTVFRPYISTIGGAGTYTALPTFTVSSLPETGTNFAGFTGLTAQISIPVTVAPGTYRISLGSGGPNNNLPADNPEIFGDQTPGTGQSNHVDPTILSNTFTVNAPAVGGTVSPASRTVCSGQTSGVLTLSGNTGNVLRWERSTDNVNFTTSANTTTTTTFNSVPLTQTTYFRAVVQNGNCTATSSVTTVTVTPSNTAGAASSTPTLCINTALTPITHNTTGATGIGTPTDLPAGVTAVWNSNRITISGTPTASGTFSYSIPLTGGCSAVNATGTITVTQANTVTAASASPTVCISTAITPITHNTTGATGIGTPTGLPAGVTAVWNSNVITISGTPTASGTFTYSIPLTGGCLSVNAAGTITVGKLTTYNGTTWSDGVPSHLTTSMIVNSGTYITSGNLSACNCTVNPGAALTIASNSSLTLENYLRNNGGTVTVESDGNLVQINNSAANTGNITVKRNARMKRLDYTYWGSPVSGQNLKAFSPGTVNNRFYTYNEFNDFFEIIDPLTNVFGNNRLGAFESDAKGYTIRANNAYPAWTDPATAVYTTFEGIFKGTPHNGNITFPLQKLGGGHNLVGNPYASNIDFHAVAAAGTIEGVAYFWTNANPTPATQEGSSYAGTNYSVYTVLSGGTPALNGGPETKPERFIKVGQGFIVQAKAAGTLAFNNAMRDNGTGGASNFINKSAATKSEATDRFWLKLTTPAKNFNTILVAYPKGATNGFESNADARQLTGSSDEFYSVQNDMKLIIQGRQFPLQNTDKVELGMKNHQAGTYTLSLSEKEGVFANGQAVYLTDSQTGTVTNLSESNYTFTAAAGVADNRFELSYEPQAKVLATDTATKEKVEVYKDAKAFVIRSAGKKITGLEVYDATGKLMISSAPQQTEARVEAGNWPKGTYILKISRNGEIITRKVLN